MGIWMEKVIKMETVCFVWGYRGAYFEVYQERGWQILEFLKEHDTYLYIYVILINM